MSKVEYITDEKRKFIVPKELIKGKRHLTAAEIKILEKNQNHNEDKTWKNFFLFI